MKSIKGKIADPIERRIFNGEIFINDGIIESIRESDDVPDQYILPGLVDAHIHIESSMLVPSEFARLAVQHGTVATVSDPHEIANVCGTDGISFMIENGKKVPLKFFFGAPSCVPATTFERAAASISQDEVARLLHRDGIEFLLQNGKQVALKCCFGAAFCVPAATFETAGASISPDEGARLLQREEIR